MSATENDRIHVDQRTLQHLCWLFINVNNICFKAPAADEDEYEERGEEDEENNLYSTTDDDNYE